MCRSRPKPRSACFAGCPSSLQRSLPGKKEIDSKKAIHSTKAATPRSASNMRLAVKGSDRKLSHCEATIAFIASGCMIALPSMARCMDCSESVNSSPLSSTSGAAYMALARCWAGRVGRSSTLAGRWGGVKLATLSKLRRQCILCRSEELCDDGPRGLGVVGRVWF